MPQRIPISNPFLQKLNGYISENDKKLKLRAEKGNCSYQLDNYDAFKIRVSVKEDRISVDLYSWSDKQKRTPQRIEAMEELQNKLDSSLFSFNGNSTIKVNEQHTLSNTERDIAWVMDKIKEMKDIIRTIEKGEGLPADLLSNGKNQEGCPQKKDSDKPRKSKSQDVAGKVPNHSETFPDYPKCSSDNIDEKSLQSFGKKKIKNVDGEECQIGTVASWAIWREPIDGNPDSDSGMKVENMFTDEKILSKLRSDIMFLGLNVSRSPNDSDQTFWQNVHYKKDDSQVNAKNGQSNTLRFNRKFRYACRKTMFEGAFVTDYFIQLEETASKKIKGYLTIKGTKGEEHCKYYENSFDALVTELCELKKLRNGENSCPMVLVALGRDLYKLFCDESFKNRLLCAMPETTFLLAGIYHPAFNESCRGVSPDDGVKRSFTVYRQHFWELSNLILQGLKVSLTAKEKITMCGFASGKK